MPSTSHRGMAYYLIKRQRPLLDRREELHLFAIIALAIVPCFIQVYSLRNHSWVHDFSALKMEIPVQGDPPRLTVHDRGILANLKTGAGRHEHKHFKEFFPPPNREMQYLGDLFAENITYNDIVVSKEFSIETIPPQLLSYTMKRVYKIITQQDVDNIVRGIKEPYQIKLLKSQ